MSMQPTNEDSARAEGAWLVLDAVDTLQTVQLAKHPACYREDDKAAVWLYGSEHPAAARVALTNVVLAISHTMVTAWLDDRVDAARDTDSYGPWVVTRFVWHAISLGASGAAVANNFSKGLTPTSAKCAT